MFENFQINVETDIASKFNNVQERLDQFQDRINQIPDIIANQSNRDQNNESNGLNEDFQQKLMELNQVIGMLDEQVNTQD